MQEAGGIRARELVHKAALPPPWCDQKAVFVRCNPNLPHLFRHSVFELTYIITAGLQPPSRTHFAAKAPPGPPPGPRPSSPPPPAPLPVTASGAAADRPAGRGGGAPPSFATASGAILDLETVVPGEGPATLGARRMRMAENLVRHITSHMLGPPGQGSTLCHAQSGVIGLIAPDLISL